MVDRRILSDSSLLLALETATSDLSVALLRGDDLLDEERAAPGAAAETLLPAIDSLLSRAGVMVADLLTKADAPRFDPELFRLGRFAARDTVAGGYEYSIVG